MYITIEKTPELTEGDVASIKAECAEIISRNIPLVRKRLDIKEALSLFEADGQRDKAELLRWRQFNYFDVYMPRAMSTTFTARWRQAPFM